MRGISGPSSLIFFFPLFKRFASLSRFVETLVVADDKMAAFHGTGLKRYLLTVMAAAAKAFKHPSIRNPVNLVVTRLVILGSGQEGPQVGPSAAQTLRSFCTWQRGLNTPNDSDPDHFDTAILFTRQVRPQSAPQARDHNTERHNRSTGHDGRRCPWSHTGAWRQPHSHGVSVWALTVLGPASSLVPH